MSRVMLEFFTLFIVNFAVFVFVQMERSWPLAVLHILLNLFLLSKGISFYFIDICATAAILVQPFCIFFENLIVTGLSGDYRVRVTAQSTNQNAGNVCSSRSLY